MANIRGIELASEVYNLEDTSARNTATAASQTATTASETATTASETATQASETATQASETATQADSKIGDLADLETTAKTDLVSAINEVNSKADPTIETFTTSKDGLTVSGEKRGNFVQLIILGEYTGGPTTTLIFNDSLPSAWRPPHLIRALGIDINDDSLSGFLYCTAAGRIAWAGLDSADFSEGVRPSTNMFYMI